MTSRTRSPSPSGPPRTTKPSSTSASMNAACSSQPSCSRRSRDVPVRARDLDEREDRHQATVLPGTAPRRTSQGSIRANTSRRRRSRSQAQVQRALPRRMMKRVDGARGGRPARTRRRGDDHTTPDGSLRTTRPPPRERHRSRIDRGPAIDNQRSRLATPPRDSCQRAGLDGPSPCRRRTFALGGGDKGGPDSNRRPLA